MDAKKVWRTVTEDLPGVVRVLEPFIAEGWRATLKENHRTWKHKVRDSAQRDNPWLIPHPEECITLIAIEAYEAL